MKNILLLQTGGTIAMHFDKNGHELNTEKWSDTLYNEIPELTQIANIQFEKVFFEDSSDVNKTHWKKLSEIIYSEYANYDGFVILHGTDTMAYTATALSFALRNISKPVIMTGSQVPMSKIRSDARRNVVNSIELATCPIHEVAICFNDHLFRGNRATKMSIGDFDAFASPNFPPLAEIGIDIKINNQKSIPNEELECVPLFDDAFHVIKAHPNLNPKLLGCLDLTRAKAVIIEAFGSGNIPMKGDYNMIPFIKKCREQNCHVIITSQAPYDAVDLDQYKSGRTAKNLGAISAGEMTIEACIIKTMHLLGLKLADDDFKVQFESNLAGERS